MYCPRCATQSADETNFCNKCGLTLRSVPDAPSARTTNEQFDWSKTWLVDMLLTDDERKRRRAAVEISGGPEGATVAEMNRAGEVKGGIIASFAGVGLSIFLWVFLGAIAASVEAKDPTKAAVLRHIWAVGIIPFFVGLGIVLSALFIDTSVVRLTRAAIHARLVRAAEGPRGKGRTTGELPALNAPPSVVSSVTEHTTNLLTETSAPPQGASTGRLVQK